MKKKFSLEMKLTKSKEFLWIPVDLILLIILSQKVSKSIALLYIHTRILFIYLRYLINMCKIGVVLFRAVFVLKNAPDELEENERIINPKFLEDAFRLILFLCICGVAVVTSIECLVYTYIDFNLHNVLPTYFLTRILLLLVNRRTYFEYVKFYNLKKKLKKQ